MISGNEENKKHWEDCLDLFDHATIKSIELKLYGISPITVNQKFKDGVLFNYLKSNELVEGNPIIDKFKICSNISEELKIEIKIFHVFDDMEGYNVLFITRDDKVFGFGSNSEGCCGLGHNSVVNEPQIIPELCHKNIQQFFIGLYFTLGLSSDEKVFSWGKNNVGQLGRGLSNYIFQMSKSEEYSKPEIIDFSNVKIIHLSCRESHSLALSSDGQIYGWGDNRYGEVGCGADKGSIIFKPINLEFFNQMSIKSIYATGLSSFALTENGLVYSWGSNVNTLLGHELNEDEWIFEPKLINISNIICVCPTLHNTYFLTNEGQIFFLWNLSKPEHRFISKNS